MTDAAPLPPVFVISLRHATDRRAAIAAGLRSIGIDFEIVDATDGAHLTSADFQRYSEWRALRENKRGLCAGELGAALSHLRVYEEMLRRGVGEPSSSR